MLDDIKELAVALAIIALIAATLVVGAIVHSALCLIRLAGVRYKLYV